MKESRTAVQPHTPVKYLQASKWPGRAHGPRQRTPEEDRLGLGLRHPHHPASTPCLLSQAHEACAEGCARKKSNDDSSDENADHVESVAARFRMNTGSANRSSSGKRHVANSA